MAWLKGAACLLAWLLASLVALALVVFVALLIRWRRFPLTLTQTFWYHVNEGMAKALWRAKISGPLPIPPDQGAVIACNHLSPIDPCFIELATRRVVRWNKRTPSSVSSAAITRDTDEGSIARSLATAAKLPRLATSMQRASA